ncbi:MAG: PAS domain-containing protein, partial [Planctomycetota bacterium]
MAEPDSPADPTGAVADSNDSSQTSFFQDRDPRAGEAGHDSSVRDGKRLRHRQEGYWLDRVPVEVRESLLSTMVNAANTMITLSEAGDGPDHPLVYVNRYFCEFTGYEPEEVLGRDCRFLQFRNGRRVTEGNEAGRLRISTALKDRNYERVVIRNFKKNGEEFANELYLSPMEDDGGVVRYYVGVQNDVTRQVRLIEKLRKSEASLSAAFASCPTGLALVERIDDGSATHLRVSEFAARLLLGEENGFGRGAADEGAASSPSELIDRCLGRSLDDLNLGGPVVDWLQTAFDQLSQAKPPAEPLRVRLEQAIGGRMRRLAVAAALVDQKDDGTSRFCYIVEDLTDLEALEADLALMRAAVHQTDVPTLLLTPDLGAPGPTIQYANPAAASLLGYAVEELTGEVMTKLYGPEADPDAPARLRSALRQSGRFHGESRVQRADESSLTVMWDVSAVRDGDGTPTHFAATLRDLRDQRA